MQNKSCYICEQIETTYERYLATFFELFKRNEDEFMELLKMARASVCPISETCSPVQNAT